jgi:GTP cyclohydrolase FolE2
MRQNLEKRVFEWSAKIIELIKKVDENKLEVMNYMNTMKSLVG